jgi:hypothetical protein
VRATDPETIQRLEYFRIEVNRICRMQVIVGSQLKPKPVKDNVNPIAQIIPRLFFHYLSLLSVVGYRAIIDADSLAMRFLADFLPGIALGK